jgi:hypothetical protein
LQFQRVTARFRGRLLIFCALPALFRGWLLIVQLLHASPRPAIELRARERLTSQV